MKQAADNSVSCARTAVSRALKAAVCLLLLCICVLGIISWPKSVRTAVVPRPGRAFIQPCDDALPGQIDLNTADAARLTELPGIGDKYAASILELRDALGGFHHKEELHFVRGIGDKRFEAIRDLVCIGPAETE